jgi:hypothetical protein
MASWFEQFNPYFKTLVPCYLLELDANVCCSSFTITYSSEVQKVSNFILVMFMAS